MHSISLPTQRLSCRSPAVHRSPKFRSFSGHCKPSKHASPVVAAAAARPPAAAKKLPPERHGMGELVDDGDAVLYRERFIVRCSEVGVNRTATIASVAALLQEVGCNYVLSFGLSTNGFSTTATMRELGLIWVLSRIHVEIYKYPAWHEVVEIETWLRTSGRIGDHREWILRDLSSSEVIGRATSNWLMMNQETRKLQRVSDTMREEYIACMSKTNRSAFPAESSESSKKIPKLKGPAQYLSLGLVPRRSDLDMNQHVNNVTFITWVLESMPEEIINNYELQAITVDYRRECRHDGVVDSLANLEIAEEDGVNGCTARKKNGEGYKQFLHFLRLSDDGPEIGRGRTVWKKVVR